METEVIKKFYVDLMKYLPMDQPLFRAELTAVDLLPGSLKSIILSKPTREEKVEYFLDNGINNDAESFSKLIRIMLKSEHDQLKILATKIQSCIKTGKLKVNGELYSYSIMLNTFVHIVI